MNKRIIKIIYTKIIPVFSLIFFFSCSNEQAIFEKYDFRLKGYDWDLDAYKFSSTIKDSIYNNAGNESAACESSFIGDIESVHAFWDVDAQQTIVISEQEKLKFLEYKEKNAIEYILEKAESHQIVIINEAHHMPQHRVFTTHLLDGLSKLGFSHLGLETYLNFPMTDSIFQSHGYPTLQLGIYTKEPQFGNLVREALNKNYQIFGYEDLSGAGGKQREIAQAKNIQDHMEKNPNEKILIYCGYAHGYEGELNNSWGKAMAGRLSELTGLDPLTINQTIYSERSLNKYENPYYQLTDLDEPSVFLDEEGLPFGEYSNGGSFDVAVFHTRSKDFNHPSWMQYGDRREVEVVFDNAEINCPCLVFAYIKGEEIGAAVPYDIKETNEKKVNLMLDESDYNIIILNEKGTALKSELNN